jgi:hypothetical protein
VRIVSRGIDVTFIAGCTTDQLSETRADRT